MKKRAKRAKIMTIEGLAVAMAEGFADVNTRFDALERKFDARFDKLEKKIEDLDRRVTALEMKVSGIYRQFADDKLHRLDVQQLLSRVAKLEEKVYGK